MTRGASLCPGSVMVIGTVLMARMRQIVSPSHVLHGNLLAYPAKTSVYSGIGSVMEKETVMMDQMKPTVPSLPLPPQPPFLQQKNSVQNLCSDVIMDIAYPSGGGVMSWMTVVMLLMKMVAPLMDSVATPQPKDRQPHQCITHARRTSFNAEQGPAFGKLGCVTMILTVLIKKMKRTARR